MAALYINRHGATLRIRGERFSVTMGEETLMETPAIKVDQVVIFGNGILTPQAMDYLFKHNIETCFMTESGVYRGRLQPPMTQSLSIRKAQFEMGGNGEQCLNLARSAVLAKIQNSLHLVSKRGRKARVGNQTRRLRDLMKQVPKAESLDELRGLEGSASVAYFEAFRSFLKDAMGFRKRIKHPPEDPVNILLSLGYTLLFNRVHSMIHCVGLDPYLGFFHQPKHGRASLASDLMEALRAPVVDTLVLRVINLGIIQEKDFTRKEGNLVFERPAFKRYLEEYDERVKSRRHFEPADKKLDFMQIIEWQCRHFARVLTGRDEAFTPFLWGGN